MTQGRRERQGKGQVSRINDRAKMVEEEGEAS